ncbi:ClpP/crotonase [Mollisia scopiformis]|uniref:ClpP/crotonase n=1 Tax=Mollisia scopiformis TaxID=149040 RepID=A0A194XB44_MOLSC|nr:ClpP/crotonase [Mollisia scopiformis]KUJ16977.1 ClpP/crotonase [Mollisia scopiformis]
MIPSPTPLSPPTTYETLPLTHIKVTHYPPGSPTATQVVVVSLNRPEKQNAFTVEMMGDFETIYPLLDVDERVKVIVLTGAGRTFCAGADLERGFKGGEERAVDHRDGGGRVALAIYRCRKPTVAAMQGSAVGVGMTMVLPAAIRIAHETSKYGFVFARRGITMESASSFFLPRLIGYSRAMYLITTGAVFPPTSPHFGHLFQETVKDANEVLPRAIELATEIAEHTSGLAGFLNRNLMWRGPGSAEESHLVDSAVLYHMFSNRDQREGVSSFLEKRRPRFEATVEEDAPPTFPWWVEVDTGSRAKVRKGPAKL